MAGYSLHNTYVVPWLKALAALDTILTKAEAHAKETGVDVDAEYIGAKLYDNMLPLTFQVQTVSSQIKLPLSLLAGNAPEWENDEKTFADLHARIKKTQDYANSVKPEDIDGREEEILKLPSMLAARYPNGLAAKDICESLTNPNIYFHVVTAYGILRKQGVPLGKFDYLGPFLPTPL